MQNKFYPPLDLRQTTSPNRLQGLWRLLSGFKSLYMASVAGLALAALAKTFTYLLLRDFADEAIAGAEGALPLHYFAIGFVVLALFEASFTFVAGKMAARATEGAILRLRNFLFDHLQRLPFSYHDRTKTGELIQRSTSDVDVVRRFFAEQGTQLGRIVMLFVINLIALMVLNLKLALYSVVLIPLIVITAYIFFKKLNVVYEDFQQEEARLSTILQENLSGVRVVKAFARQKFEMDKFEESNSERFRKGRKVVMMHASFWPISDLITGGQMLLAFYLGARMAINGEITVGTYLAFANLIIWVIWPIRNLGRLIAQASTGLVSYRRVADIIDEHREVTDAGQPLPPEQARGEVVFEDVEFAYEIGKPVLYDLNFRVEPGQTVALMGPTGSGKSSLVNLLPRFYEYTGGRILLDGIPLTDYRVSDLRSIVGMVEQEPFLFSRSIRDNLTYGVHREVSDAEVEAAAQAAAVHEVILGFPAGYQTLVGEKGVTLSGGQKQRIALARTLLKDPRVLILDDSTSSVDTETEMLIQQALNHLMEGRTTFVIAHRIQTVMRADLILVMRDGKIVQRGTHQTLVQEPGLYREIYDIQAKIDEDIQTETQAQNGHGGHPVAV